MPARQIAAFLISSSILSAATLALAQDKPAGDAGGAVARDVKDLSAQDFAKREEAIKHLQTLVGEQIKQRAQIQEILNAFQADLAQQQRALAMVNEEEAQAQVAGLLEMERGLTSWTIQTMAEPVERRKALLDWGLSNEAGPTLARVYATHLRVRLAGIAELGKLKGESVDWTIGRLVSDRETAVRAAAMAACWSRPPSAELVNALWYRAVSGPQALGESARGLMNTMEGRMMMEMQGVEAMENTIKVEFPGGEPIEFDDTNDAGEFFDSQLAAAVLVHMNSPIVGEKVKALVAERAKAGKTLSLNSDEDWTLVTHRLVETYQVKEAIPMLAAEALGAETDDMTSEMNGRPFAWSRRTMAIGALGKLMGKDPTDFGLIRARDQGDPRGWEWGVEINRQQAMNGGEGDGPAVRAFYAFWKDHHGEYGVSEAPVADNVPKPGQGPNQGVPMPGRLRGRPMPVDGPPGVQPDGAAPEGGPAVQPMPANGGGAAG